MRSLVPVQLGDDLAHGLGGTGGGGDDVLGGAAPVPPQLAGGAVDSLLRGSDGVDCALEGADRKQLIFTTHLLL